MPLRSRPPDHGRSLLLTAFTVIVIGVCWRPGDPLGQERAEAPREERCAEARARGVTFDRSLAVMQRLRRGWLTHADPRTLLLPDRIPGGPGGLPSGDAHRLYTPHNSGADLYPYYRLRRAGENGPPLVRLGSELIAGVELAPGEWVVEAAGRPPYARGKS